LFVHLFTDLHFVLNTDGPSRVLAIGALRFWKDGRDAADVIAGLYDYPKTATHPAFNLSLRANLADRDDSVGMRFVGSERVMTMWDDVTVVSKPRARAPGYTIDTFPTTVQEAFLKDYRTRYPDE